MDNSKEGLEEQPGSNVLWPEGWEKQMGKGTKGRYRNPVVLSTPRVCRVASLSMSQPESCPSVMARGGMNSSYCYHHPEWFTQTTDCALLSWENSGMEAAKRRRHELLGQWQPLPISQKMEKSIAAGSREQCSVRAGHPARALEMARKPERRLTARTSATSVSPHHFWFRDSTEMDDAEAPEYIAKQIWVFTRTAGQNTLSIPAFLAVGCQTTCPPHSQMLAVATMPCQGKKSDYCLWSF